MIRTGVEARCERCGRIEFFEDKGLFRLSDWSVREGKDVCPECAKEFDALLEQFFNEFWDK